MGDSYLPGDQQLTYSQIAQLWTSQGGDPTLAPVMAAIAMAESGGHTGVVNDTPSTGDYSVGLWQINYFGNLAPGRTQQFGSPDQLGGDPASQARAAIALAGDGGGLSNWSTYTSGAYKQYLNGGGSSSSGGSGAVDAGFTGAPASWWNPLSWGSGVDAIGNFLKAIAWIVSPVSWLRIVAFLLGVAFGGLGLIAYVQAV